LDTGGINGQSDIHPVVDEKNRSVRLTEFMGPFSQQEQVSAG
jgi:hypothetical protein